MAWTTPPTATVGEVWTAAKMNIIRDDLNALQSAVLIPKHAAGYYYGGPWVADSTVTQVLTANRLYSCSYVVPSTGTYDRIAVSVLALGGSNLRLGIYADNNGLPGSLILDAGVVAVNTIGTKFIIISQSLAGLAQYHLAGVPDANVTIGRGRAVGGQGDPADTLNGWNRTFTYGSLPDPWGTPEAIAGPSIMLRRA